MNSKIKQKIEANRKPIKLTFYIVLLVLSLISAFRIPYIGQFFDATIFSFIFGYAKYILYLYIVVICILKLSNCQRKPLYSKRVFLFVLILTVCISILLGGIEIIAHDRSSHLISFYIHDVWLKYIWNFNFITYPNFGHPSFVDGGIIGSILGQISGIFLIIFAFIIGISLYFVISKTSRDRVVNWFWKAKQRFYKNKSIIKEAKYKIKKTYQISNIDTLKQGYFSLDDNYGLNLINIDVVKKNLEEFLKNNSITTSDIQAREDNNEIVLSFTINDSEYSKFLDVKQLLSMIFNNLEYSMIHTDENVIINIGKINKKVNDILFNYLSFRSVNDLEYCLCLSEYKKPVIFSFNAYSAIGISDIEHKHIYGFLNALITQLTINYQINALEVYMLNPINSNELIINSQNMPKKSINNLHDVETFINSIYNISKTIDELYEKQDIKNFNELRKCDEYKYKFVIIDNIIQIMHGNYELFKKIKYLVENSVKYGLIFVIIDNSKGGLSFKEINYSVNIGFNMDQKTSKEVFDSSSAKNKVINDNALLYIPSKKEKYRIVIPRMNNSELQFIQNKLISILTNYKL